MSVTRIHQQNLLVRLPALEETVVADDTKNKPIKIAEKCVRRTASDTPTAPPTAPNNRSVSTQSTSYGVLAKCVVPKMLIQHNHNKHLLIKPFKK